MAVFSKWCRGRLPSLLVVLIPRYAVVGARAVKKSTKVTAPPVLTLDVLRTSAPACFASGIFREEAGRSEAELAFAFAGVRSEKQAAGAASCEVVEEELLASPLAYPLDVAASADMCAASASGSVAKSGGGRSAAAPSRGRETDEGVHWQWSAPITDAEKKKKKQQQQGEEAKKKTKRQEHKKKGEEQQGGGGGGGGVGCTPPSPQGGQASAIPRCSELSSSSSSASSSSSSALPSSSAVPVPSFSYELVATIEHHGSSLQSGHYTATRKRCGQWWHCDDASVVPVDAAIATAPSEAYLLCYQRVDDAVVAKEKEW
jgi:hypothetical protein